MKKTTNNSWLLILMIVSQVMLTGLVFQWLMSQWQDKKESFEKEINAEFRESVNQVLDSMLVKHLIVPVLNDSVSFPENRIFSRRSEDSNNKKGQHLTAFYNSTGGDKKTIVTISLGDSTKRLPDANIAFGTYDSTEKKMLLRSVRLIIKQTGDTTQERSHFNHLVSAVPDTILLKSIVDNKFRKPGYKLNIRWFSDSISEKTQKNSSSLYFESYLLDKPFGAEINHFHNILIKEILPQILFAFILLLFTGTAFIFTWISLRKMEKLNTLRNDFISNISHELKTPVSTVSVALEALKNFDRIKDPAKSHEYLDIAGKEMKRLDLLITQVLDTSSLEGHNQFLKTEGTDIVSLTREVINSMEARFLLQNAKIKFETNVISCILDLDRLHIQGVIINLLDNSLKYGIENPEILISIDETANSVLLGISDNGPGIPEEFISKVFEKFFRVPKGDLHNVKGYGLGLSFADLVMKLHGGTISVRNLNETGCEFTLNFPKIKR
jgi:signal transduction histidine kinase